MIVTPNDKSSWLEAESLKPVTRACFFYRMPYLVLVEFVGWSSFIPSLVGTEQDLANESKGGRVSH